MSVEIVCDDVLHWAETYEGPQAHALLCDAPYHLSEVKTSGQSFGSQLTHGRTAEQRQARTGFMQTAWDGGDIAFRPATWAALARHLLPGAFLMVFASTRGYHRLACALEDAGLILHPVIVWIFGSGWPKATMINNERFYGHRYGRQCLKPSCELIAVCQKPYENNRAVDSIVKYGAGALNIEAGRVPTGGGNPTAERYQYGLAQETQDGKTGIGYAKKNFGKYAEDSSAAAEAGRWPPNLALVHLDTCRPVGTTRVRGTHDGHDTSYARSPSQSIYSPKAGQGDKQHYAAPDGTEEVQAWACSEGCPVREIDRQAGTRDSTWRPNRVVGSRVQDSMFGKRTLEQTYPDDTGMVSRFYPQHGWAHEVAERLAGVMPARYCGKSSASERAAGLAGTEGMMQLRKDLTPEQRVYVMNELARAGVVP